MEGWTVIDYSFKLIVLRVEECRALVRRGAACGSISIQYHVMVIVTWDLARVLIWIPYLARLSGMRWKPEAKS